MNAAPPPDEIAAIALALASMLDSPPSSVDPYGPARVAPWTAAMRRPELDVDELRAFARASHPLACSTRS